jgi:hypothetical protein
MFLPQERRFGPAGSPAGAGAAAPAGARPGPELAHGQVTALHYSIGLTITEDMQEAILKVPARSWTPA